MTGSSLGRRRRRIYERAFDWLEARARWRAGESQASIARDYGVDVKSVRRVVHMSEARARAASEEQIAALPRDPDKEPCPRCTRPKSKSAELCRDCFNELRLEPMELRHIPAVPKTELRNVEPGRIVLVGVRYGVLLGRRDPASPGYRLVDFWEGGLELINPRTLVRVEPGVEVLVGGVDDGGEEIAE